MTKTVHAKAITKIESGKKSRAAGQRFEKKVRAEGDIWLNNRKI